jgi:hypothetical protein
MFTGGKSIRKGKGESCDIPVGEEHMFFTTNQYLGGKFKILPFYSTFSFPDLEGTFLFPGCGCQLVICCIFFIFFLLSLDFLETWPYWEKTRNLHISQLNILIRN